MMINSERAKENCDEKEAIRDTVAERVFKLKRKLITAERKLKKAEREANEAYQWWLITR